MSATPPRRTEMPKPNFIDVDISPQNNEKSTDNCVTRNSYPTLHIPSPNSPIRSSLSSSDKASLKFFLSLISGVESSAEKLYSFCEHHFNEDLASLAVSVFENQMNLFKDLQTQIICQKEFEKTHAESQTPSPVSFSIGAWRNLSNDEWPEATSEDWVEVAVRQLRGPIQSPDSPKRDSISLEEKLSNADEKRRKIENLKRLQIRKHTNKVRKVIEKKNQEKVEAEITIKTKQENAQKRREEIIKQKQMKVHDDLEKVQELKYIQELETEGRKAFLERKTDETIKRHEEKVRQTQEQARERSQMKTSSSRTSKSPQRSGRTIKNNSMTLLQSIGCGRLPGDLFCDDDIPEFDSTIPIPVIVETPTKLSSQLSSMLQKIRQDSADPSSLLRFLKAVVEQKSQISAYDPNAEIIVIKIRDLLNENAPIAEQALHHISTMLARGSISLPFRIGIETLSLFPLLCEKHNSLKSVSEFLSLWKGLLSPKIPIEARSYFLKRLSHSVVFDRICFVISAVTIEDFENESLKGILNECIQLLLSTANCFFEFPKQFEDVREYIVECIDRIIGPSLLTFLTMMSVSDIKAPYPTLIEASRTLSLFTICFGEIVSSFIDDQIASTTNKFMRAFLSSTKVPRELVHEIILLYGLLCHNSSTMMESCCWVPTPTVLSLLCTQPLVYFLKSPNSEVLIPTLIACCRDSPVNTSFVLQNVNGKILSKYLSKDLEEFSGVFAPLYRIRKEEIPKYITQFCSTNI